MKLVELYGKVRYAVQMSSLVGIPDRGNEAKKHKGPDPIESDLAWQWIFAGCDAGGDVTRRLIDLIDKRRAKHWLPPGQAAGQRRSLCTLDLGVHPAQAAVLSSSISLASVATHPPVPTAMEATNQRHDTSAGSLVTLNRKGYLAEKAYKVAEPAKPIATARTIAAATTRASAGAITTTATGYFKDFLCTQITKAVVCLSSL